MSKTVVDPAQAEKKVSEEKASEEKEAPAP
jgi:hypothetical protein